MTVSTTPMSTSIPKARPDFAATRKPQSPIAIFFWRRRMWFESTFVFSMLEPWEKILLLIIIFLSFSLLVTGIIKYLPQHLFFMRRRAIYYLWGQEGDESFLWRWLGTDVVAPSGLYKEL